MSRSLPDTLDTGGNPPPPAAVAPARQPAAERRVGVLASLIAYLCWGVFPIYFKALTAEPLEIVAHRVVWSALFLLLTISLSRGWGWFYAVLRSPRLLALSLLSASLLGGNWFVYIWAVEASRVVDASLGYFITPLLSVSIGVRMFQEALRAAQWLAIGLAALGVVWLSVEFGQPPWIGLALAASFGSYGALRKAARLGALEGLALETWLMFPISLGYLIWLGTAGPSVTFEGSLAQRWALVAAGPITSVPLLLFAAGARRIPLSLTGVLQYVTPTLQLLLGVLLWHEPFPARKLIGYGLIWLALAIYSAEGLWVWRDRARV